MTIESRLKRLERATGMAAVKALMKIPPPEKIPEKIWQRALELLAARSDEMVGPGMSVRELVQSCLDNPPKTLSVMCDSLGQPGKGRTGHLREDVARRLLFLARITLPRPAP
jgi:hypothetical protein